jgi:hypothetical protein
MKHLQTKVFPHVGSRDVVVLRFRPRTIPTWIIYLHSLSPDYVFFSPPNAGSLADRDQ